MSSLVSLSTASLILILNHKSPASGNTSNWLALGRDELGRRGWWCEIKELREKDNRHTWQAVKGCLRSDYTTRAGWYTVCAMACTTGDMAASFFSVWGVRPQHKEGAGQILMMPNKYMPAKLG
ncbi:hypothetical protein C8R44DRAFT_728072 [Mycena epipterygia]|nr:hypothetical protein C8R44DRAFT_728072 [Mycena epipterygia]